MKDLFLHFADKNLLPPKIPGLGWVKNLADSVGSFRSEMFASGPESNPEKINPVKDRQEYVTRSFEETNSKAELLIKDQTGKAQVSILIY